MDVIDGAKLEEKFVKTFINKNFQERSIFELNSKSKRLKFFSKICHDYTNYFKQEYMIEYKDDLKYITKEIQVKTTVANAMSYTMAYDTRLDKCYTDLNSGVRFLSQTLMPIILYINEYMAIFQPEAEINKPKRFILLPKKTQRQ